MNMEEIQNTLIELYQRNLNFLNTNFKDIYDEVIDLSKKIESDTYTTRYEIDYKDGYFDIFDKENDTYLYNENSYVDSDLRTDLSNKTDKTSFNLLRVDSTNEKLFLRSHLFHIEPVVSFINNNIDFQNVEFKKIYKYIFIGVGLGLHIEPISRKLNPEITMIIEPNLEIFRLSLFTLDYSSLLEGKKKLYLNIGNSYSKRIAMISSFHKEMEYINYTVKYNMLNTSYQYINEELINFYFTNTKLNYSYMNILNDVKNMITYVKNKERFLDLNLSEEHKILADKKVLLVAAGPSLDNYLELIKKNQNKFYIIAVDIIVRKLESLNIIPDMVVSIDPSPSCANFLTLENSSFLKNSVIVFLSGQHEDTINIVKDSQYYFTQNIQTIPSLGHFGTTQSVGSYAYLMAIKLGAKDIYTIGTDAAFNQETGSRYASNDLITTKDSLENDINKSITDKMDTIEVTGNLRKIIKTNRYLNALKDDFVEVTLSNERRHKVYNLSDGVLIDGFEPLLKEEFVKSLKKFNDIDKTKNILVMNSISRTVEEYNFMDDKQILIKILQKLKKYQKVSIKDDDNFMAHKLDLMLWILKELQTLDSSLYYTLFMSYTLLIDIYINFIINLKDKNIHTKKNLNKLFQIYVQGTKALFTDIKEILI